MRLLLPLLAAVGLGTVLVVSPQALTLNGASAQQGNLPPANPNCQPFGDAVPAGVEVPVPSDEPSLPIWCYPLSAPTETYVEGANDWVDTYDNDGPALQRIDTDEYNVFPDTSGGRIAVGTFVNGDHWRSILETPVRTG